MYSGVFGVTLAPTAEILLRYLLQDNGLTQVKIVDLDEDKYRSARIIVIAAGELVLQAPHFEFLTRIT